MIRPCVSILPLLSQVPRGMKLQQHRLLCWPCISSQSCVPLASKTYALASLELLAIRTPRLNVACCNHTSVIGNELGKSWEWRSRPSVESSLASCLGTDMKELVWWPHAESEKHWWEGTTHCVSSLQSKLLLEARQLPRASVSRSKGLHLTGLISSFPNFPCLVAAATSLPLCQHQGSPGCLSRSQFQRHTRWHAAEPVWIQISLFTSGLWLIIENCFSHWRLLLQKEGNRPNVPYSGDLILSLQKSSCGKRLLGERRESLDSQEA